MKVWILTICGAAPLVILTLFSLVHVLAPSPLPAASPAFADAAGPDTRRQVENDLESVKAMASLEGADSKRKDIPKPATDSLAEVVIPWSRLHELKTIYTQLQVAGDVDTQMARMQQISAKYKESLELLDKDGATIDGKTQRLTSSFDAAIKNLKTAQKRQRDAKAHTDMALRALLAAEKDFKDGNYEACLVDVKNFENELLEDDVRLKLENIRKRASFRNDYEHAKKPMSSAERSEKLAKLLLQHPAPPSPEDRDLYEDARARHINSLAECKLDEWKRQAHEGSIALTPMRVSALVKEVARPGVDITILHKLERELKDWRETSLKPMDVAEFDQCKEAKMKDGEILVGYFRPVSAPGLAQEKESYQFRSTKPSGADYRDVHVAGLEEKPHECTHYRCAEQFNTQRSRTLKEFTSIQAWKKLAGKCQELQDKIKAFDASTSSVYKGKLVFDQQLQFVKEVITEMEDFPGLFGPFAVDRP